MARCSCCNVRIDGFAARVSTLLRTRPLCCTHAVIVGPSDEVAAIIDRLGCQPNPFNPNITVVDCGSTSGMPSISFYLGEEKTAYSLDPQDYVIPLQGGMYCM